MDTQTTPPQMRSLSILQWCELSRQGGAPPVTIRLDGDSMRPLIRKNRDEVTIVPLVRPLKKGDVVLFQGGKGQYVVHRVWKMHRGHVRTLGDNCWQADPWMPQERVLGQAVRVQRDGRNIRLDGASSRVIGRMWMTFRPVRNQWRRCRAFAARTYRQCQGKRR